MRSPLPTSAAIPVAGLALLAAGFVAWAALDVRNASDPLGPLMTPSATLVSVAYLAVEPGADRLYVQRASPGAEPVSIADFRPAFGLHARGTTSPDGTHILVVHPGQQPGTGIVTRVELPSGTTLDLGTAADYLSTFAWSPDSTRVAMTRSSAPDAVGRVQVEIFELDVNSLGERVVATAGPVFEAAPVGYDGDVLYFVTVDQSGSALFSARSGRATKVAPLSVGRTRGWVLHPDGARLAYLDVIGAGAARAVVAKVMLLTTKEITMLPGDDDHAAIVWRLHADLPDVGGPGGTVQVEGTGTVAETVYPAAWDPEGQRLLAIVATGHGSNPNASDSLEVITAGSRLLLADGQIVPLGWVTDVE